VATALQHTAYPNYEIIVVQNGTQRDTPDLSEAVLADPRVHVVHYAEGFNWAKINNWAIRDCARGDYIVTLNDDVCVGSIDRQWLDLMMGHAVRTGVGAVGAKLVHPAGVVQHIGVVCHNGIAGHMHKGTPAGQAGHLGRILLAHEAAAVTGACMLFTRHNFEAVGGFDTSWPDNYNDVVFCIEQRRQGRRIVVETSAELLHPEASSRADSSTPEGLPLLRRDNVRLLREYPEADPYWNPNMMLAAHPETFHINGLNADSLAWADFTPRPECSRVLLINDAPGAEGCVLEILRKGDVPFMADLSGFSLQLSAPGALNIPPWDIRDADRVAKDLRVLGISRIVLRSLVGYGGAAPPVETLRMLSQSRLGIPVDIQPRDLVLVAPWLVRDGRVNEQKLFGYVDMAAWQAAYVEAVKLQGEEVC
jgi:GT2 family glycosyltransferase